MTSSNEARVTSEVPATPTVPDVTVAVLAGHFAFALGEALRQLKELPECQRQKWYDAVREAATESLAGIDRVTRQIRKEPR